MSATMIAASGQFSAKIPLTAAAVEVRCRG
jgi:hypothetical protein